jgi:hypothetical protein
MIMGAYPSTRRLNKANELFSEFDSLSQSARQNPTNETKTLLQRIMKLYKKAIKGLRKKNELRIALLRLTAIKWHVYRHDIKFESSVEEAAHHRLQEVIRISKEALTIWEDQPESESYQKLRDILATAEATAAP